ncbi:MAG: c-type cytochrome, partial [Bacteroidota bacterium]|nr:c-type cytochrome [Bacteroidota bacterium]
MKRYFLSLIAFSFLIFQIVFPSQLNAQEPAEWAACKVCHTIGKGRLVGPDLKGVTERRSQEWLIPFIQKSQTMVDSGDPDAVQLFEEYKIPMPDNNLTDEQIINILNFITNYVEPAEPIADATPTVEISEAYQPYSGYGPKDSRWTTALAVLILLLILVDLSVTKFIRWKWLSMLLLFGSLGFLSKVMYVEAKALGRQEGYAPDQPVWFSHKVHSGQNQIDCIYCHSTSYDSKHAAIPGTDVCMNCHNLVTTGTQTGTTEISKIQKSWESGKPLEWVKVHNLPDHVWF